MGRHCDVSVMWNKLAIWWPMDEVTYYPLLGHLIPLFRPILRVRDTNFIHGNLFFTLVVYFTYATVYWITKIIFAYPIISLRRDDVGSGNTSCKTRVRLFYKVNNMVADDLEAQGASHRQPCYWFCWTNGSPFGMRKYWPISAGTFRH